MSVAKNNLAKTFASWGPDFSIKFDIKFLKRPIGWYNILHFTTGENCCEKGSQIPGIWLQGYDGEGPRLSFKMAMKEEQLSYESQPFNLNQWYSIEVNQRADYFSVTLDGVFVWSIETENMESKDVKLYLSNPWHPSAKYGPYESQSENVIELKKLLVIGGIGDELIMFEGKNMLLLTASTIFWSCVFIN